ncbi:MAG: hypothetical protein ACRDE5_05420 [Ginsengibacter sp.]
MLSLVFNKDEPVIITPTPTLTKELLLPSIRYLIVEIYKTGAALASLTEGFVI